MKKRTMTDHDRAMEAERRLHGFDRSAWERDFSEYALRVHREAICKSRREYVVKEGKAIIDALSRSNDVPVLFTVICGPARSHIRTIRKIALRWLLMRGVVVKRSRGYALGCYPPVESRNE